MKLTCNKVETIRPKIGRARCTCTSDKHSNCSTNRNLSKEVVQCGSVTSYKLAHMNSTDPTYIFCSQYDSVNDNQTFVCTGVRPPVGVGGRGDSTTGNDQVFQYLKNTTTVYEKYIKDKSGKSYIKHGDINPLNTNDYLGKEINRRKQHVWYSNLQLPIMDDVITNDPIKHEQQNTLNAILDSIRKSIKDNNNDYKNNATISKKASNVGSGDMVETENLRYIETDLLNINKDCICYSDCTNFKIIKIQTCTCNINCGCNYS